MNWLFFVPGVLLLLAAILIGAGDYSQRRASETPPRVVRVAAIGIGLAGALFIILSFVIRSGSAKLHSGISGFSV